MNVSRGPKPRPSPKPKLRDERKWEAAAMALQPLDFWCRHATEASLPSPPASPNPDFSWAPPGSSATQNADWWHVAYISFQTPCRPSAISLGNCRLKEFSATKQAW